jgi:ribosomal protein S18 acetylase RimI-like enzyme
MTLRDNPGCEDPGMLTEPRVHLVSGASGLEPGVAAQAAQLLGRLVADGAALGWVDPPGRDEVSGLLTSVAAAVEQDDAALALAWSGDELVGLGYWRRYARPTHRPHADLEKIAVAAGAQGCGLGRALTESLVHAARDRGIEQLTLDLRGDNTTALGLYASLGFREYGRLRDFVAVGDRRFDKVLCVLDLRR